MKVYISGPFEGIRNYLDDFREAEKTLLGLGHIAVNPARLDEAVKDCGLLWQNYLELDLALLKCCDAIVMLDGWQQSRGCNREHDYAIKTKKKIIDYCKLKKMVMEEKRWIT